MVEAVRAVLPQMRANGGGLIVPFSSLNGLLGTPFTSAYVASKHAVEGWAECLRMETRPFRIAVCVVRPGDHRSGGAAYRQHAGFADAPDSPYAAAYARGIAAIARDEAGGGDPERLARAVRRVVEARRPPATRTVARIDQRLAAWLHDLLPAQVFSWVLRLYYLGKTV
jgi:short-subunit dehydrogenase